MEVFLAVFRCCPDLEDELADERKDHAETHSQAERRGAAKDGRIEELQDELDRRNSK